MKTAVQIATAAVMVAVFGLAGVARGAAVQKVTVVMRDFSYTPSTVTLQAGVPAELTFVNKGKLAHEWMVYDRPKQMGMMGGENGHAWVEKTNYFHRMPVTVMGGKVTRHGGDFMELKVAAGATATVKFTPTKKGTFEMGCMIEDHYEAGQHGVLIVK